MVFSAVLRRWISGRGASGVFISNPIINCADRNSCMRRPSMLNNMDFFSVVRRSISGSGSAGVFRSKAISDCSARCRELEVHHGVSSSESAATAPWLMLPPRCDLCGRWFMRAYCFTTNEYYTFFTNEYSRTNGRGREWYTDSVGGGFELVGSSSGWLAYYNPRYHELNLLDPLTDQVIKLPPVDSVVHRVIVEEKGRFAFMTFGSGGSLAFCSMLRNEWTLFSGMDERVCESFVYSSVQSRLFCITNNIERNNTRFEGWELEEGDTHQSPRPKQKWMMDFDIDSMSFGPKSKKLKYLVFAEQTNELFLVVRHIRIDAGIDGEWVDGIMSTDYRGPELWKPYKTIEFDVYKIDRERGWLMHMKDSLQGFAIFLGNNHTFAIQASNVAGVKPNSIYFTYDDRIVYRMGGLDNGIFDYQKRNISPLCDPNIVEYFGKSVWFTPPQPPF